VWGWIWTLLVVAALLFLGWVAWGVVRAGLRLLREGGRSAEVFGEGARRVSDAVARAEAERTPTGATMFDDREVLRGRWRALRAAGRERRAARRLRQEPVWRSWVDSTWLERRAAARRNGD
jgi:hypothetical protein